MATLTNVKIKDVKEDVKSGTGKYGPWKLSIVHLEDPDWGEIDLSFFTDKNTKVKPEAGKLYSIIELDETDRGYLIKKLVAETEKPKPNKEKAGGARTSGYTPPPAHVLQEYKEWVTSMPTNYRGGGTFGDFLQWKNRSMFYAYGKDIALRMMELGLFPATKENVLSHAVYFGELLFKASCGDPDVQDAAATRLEALTGNGEGQPVEEPDSTSDKGSSKDESSEEEYPAEYPDPGKPDAVEMNKTQAKKRAALWVTKCAEIDNIPHLKNWWNKLCGSPERRAMEKASKESWESVCKAFSMRKEQLAARYQEPETEQGVTPNGDDVF